MNRKKKSLKLAAKSKQGNNDIKVVEADGRRSWDFKDDAKPSEAYLNIRDEREEQNRYDSAS